MISPFFVPTVCELCGEEGVTTMRAMNAMWEGARIYHIDRDVCRRNIERAKEEKERGTHGGK